MNLDIFLWELGANFLSPTNDTKSYLFSKLFKMDHSTNLTGKELKVMPKDKCSTEWGY